MTESRRSGLDGFIWCVVGTEQFALAGADIRLVARAEYMTTANRHGNRVGTLQHGAEALPVYSLAGLFGRQSDTSAAGTHIIVTRGDGDAFGLLVDRIIRTPPQGDRPALLPLPPAVGTTALAWFDGLLLVGDLLSCLVVSARGIDPQALAPWRDVAGPSAVHGGQASGTPSSGMVLTFASEALPRGQVTRYALGADRVGGIVHSLPSIPLPAAPPHVTALGWWRNQAVPILHLNGGTRGADASERYLLARSGQSGGGFVAFRVGADVAIHRATAADRRQPTRAPADWFTKGTFSIDGDQVALLDLDAVIAGPADVRENARDPVPAAV